MNISPYEMYKKSESTETFLVDELNFLKEGIKIFYKIYWIPTDVEIDKDKQREKARKLNIYNAKGFIIESMINNLEINFYKIIEVLVTLINKMKITDRLEYLKRLDNTVTKSSKTKDIIYEYLNNEKYLVDIDKRNFYLVHYDKKNRNWKENKNGNVMNFMEVYNFIVNGLKKINMDKYSDLDELNKKEIYEELIIGE